MSVELHAAAAWALAMLALRPLSVSVRRTSEERLRAYATEAVRVKSTRSSRLVPRLVAATQATTTIPIVGLDLESDPVASRFVASLARPGKNLTGLFLDLPELAAKRLELLTEAIPGIVRVALLWDPSMNPVPLPSMALAARSFGVRLEVVEARRPSDFEGAFRTAVNTRSIDFRRRASSPTSPKPGS